MHAQRADFSMIAHTVHGHKAMGNVILFYNSTKDGLVYLWKGSFSIRVYGVLCRFTFPNVMFSASTVFRSNRIASACADAPCPKWWRAVSAHRVLSSNGLEWRVRIFGLAEQYANSTIRLAIYLQLQPHDCYIPLILSTHHQNGIWNVQSVSNNWTPACVICELDSQCIQISNQNKT